MIGLYTLECLCNNFLLLTLILILLWPEKMICVVCNCHRCWGLYLPNVPYALKKNGVGCLYIEMKQIISTWLMDGSCVS